MFSANGARLPIASFSASPRPLKTRPWLISQRWNASRVFGSKARKMSSSWTVGATLPSPSVPPSRSFGPRFVPGVNSTYVSPSNVFWRRIARESRGIGAY